MTDKTTVKKAKPAKKTVKATKPEAEAGISPEIVARLEKLEKNQALLAEAFTFAANEVRPLFGFGPLALIFDAIAKRFK